MKAKISLLIDYISVSIMSQSLITTISTMDKVYTLQGKLYSMTDLIFSWYILFNAREVQGLGYPSKEKYKIVV